MREQLHGPDFPHVWQVIENGLRIDLIPKQHSRFVEVNSPPRQKTVLGYWREAFDAPAAELQKRLLERVHRIHEPFTAIFGKEVEPDYRAWLSANAGHFSHLVDPDRFADEVRTLAGKVVHRSLGLAPMPWALIEKA